MAFSKARYFRPADFHFSLLCQALSHPARIMILRKLQKGGKLSVQELRKGIPLCSASVSQHLRILREMHILNCEKVYPTVYYWYNSDLAETSDAIAELIRKVESFFPHSVPDVIKTIHRWQGDVQL